jgi:hypothetical protein
VNRTDPQTFRLDLIKGLLKKNCGVVEYLILCMGVIVLNHLLEDWTLLPGNDSCHKKEI